MLQSNYGILVVNQDSAACGNVTVALFLPLCKDLRLEFLFTLYLPQFWSHVDSISRYVVDAADPDNLSVSKSELHDLLSKTSLNGIPLLVLGNKIDKPGALSKEALTDEMYSSLSSSKPSSKGTTLGRSDYVCYRCRGLTSLTDREVCCFMISCKNSTNIDQVIDWLVKHSKSKN